MMKSDFPINAHALFDWQKCKRLYLLNREWRAAKWRPHRLFNACLRAGVLDLSNGSGAEQAIANAQTRFLETAANPGVEAAQGTNTYLAAKDWCAMLGTILTSTSRLTLLTLRDVGPKRLMGAFLWEPTAWQDDTGQLHRWISVDHWDEDVLYREMHGWPCFGDICVYESPMMLHVTEIGRVYNKRRASSWARIFKHPGLDSIKSHFRSTTGQALKGWDSVYLGDTVHADYEAWVDHMVAEGEVERLTHHVTINVPPQRVIDETVRQMIDVAMEMRATVLVDTNYRDVPMSRGACDDWSPCQYQPVCYSSEQLVKIESLGLYVKQGRSTVPAVEVPAQ